MQRREFIGRLGVAAVGAICGSSLSYAQATGSVAHRTIGQMGFISISLNRARDR